MRRVVLTLAGLVLAAGVAVARADGIEVRDLALRPTEGGLALDVDFAVELSPRLVDMVTNGVPLHFTVEFELTRDRWYWFDEDTASRRLPVVLSYHVLTRQYRLATGTLQQSFATLEEALAGIDEEFTIEEALRVLELIEEQNRGQLDDSPGGGAGGPPDY